MTPILRNTKWLLAAGALLVFSGIGLLALTPLIHPVAAQDAEPYYLEADYLGAGECSSCHRDLAQIHDESDHALTLQEVGRNEEVVLGDFSAGAEARMTQFPNEARPFEIDDIAYVIGTGRYVQRYLYEEERNNYRVLPAEWDVVAGEWRALTLAESWDDAAFDWETNCVACHTTGFNAERVRWEEDGVQCEACHGPGSEHEEVASDAGRNPNDEELAEIRAVINPATDSQVCGQCHSRGTAASGQPFAAGYIPGMTLSDVFTLAAFATSGDDHWWVSGHAKQSNMQYNEWVLSGHADAAGNGATEAVGCTTCHAPHVEDSGPAYLVSDPYALCVSCHNDTPEGNGRPAQEMYEGTVVVAGLPAFAGVHFNSDDGPKCATCHLPEVAVESGVRASHTFKPVVTFGVEGLTDSCAACHERQAQPSAIGLLITDIQEATQLRLDTARSLVNSTSPAWITEALDFVEHDGSLGIHNYTYSDALLDAVYDALGLYGDTEAAAAAAGAGQ